MLLSRVRPDAAVWLCPILRCWHTPAMGTSRRGFLYSTGLAGLSAGALRAGGLRAGSPAGATGAASAPVGQSVVPFYGRHQAGIATPAQNFLQFASLDMVSSSAADLRQLLRSWSRAAALMAAGRPIGRMDTGSKPPVDTGEAVGLPPSELTVTFGFGPS